MIEQIHGVKRLGYTIMVTLLLFAVVFMFLFLVYVKSITMADISGHLTMVFALIGATVGGYLGIQTVTDLNKKGGNTDGNTGK